MYHSFIVPKLLEITNFLEIIGVVPRVYYYIVRFLIWVSMDLQETLGGNISFGLSYHFPGELHLTFSSTELNSLQLCLCKENQTLIRFNGVSLKRAECIKLDASGLWYAPSYFGLRLVHHPIIRPTSPADLTMALLSKIQ